MPVPVVLMGGGGTLQAAMKGGLCEERRENWGGTKMSTNYMRTVWQNVIVWIAYETLETLSLTAYWQFLLVYRCATCACMAMAPAPTSRPLLFCSENGQPRKPRPPSSFVYIIDFMDEVIPYGGEKINQASDARRHISIITRRASLKSEDY